MSDSCESSINAPVFACYESRGGTEGDNVGLTFCANVGALEHGFEGTGKVLM